MCVHELPSKPIIIRIYRVPTSLQIKIIIIIFIIIHHNGFRFYSLSLAFFHSLSNVSVALSFLTFNFFVQCIIFFSRRHTFSLSLSETEIIRIASLSYACNVCDVYIFALGIFIVLCAEHSFIFSHLILGEQPYHEFITYHLIVYSFLCLTQSIYVFICIFFSCSFVRSSLHPSSGYFFFRCCCCRLCYDSTFNVNSMTRKKKPETKWQKKCERCQLCLHIAPILFIWI